jgi:hypothetical protein
MLRIPPVLAGDLYTTMMHKGADPVVQDFAAHAFADPASWSPAWPRRLLDFAGALGVTLTGVDRVIVLSVGFRDSGCPRRLGRALRVIVRRWRRRKQPSGLIYADGRDLLVFGDGEPRRRWGPTESIMQPRHYPSPMGPMPVTETPAPPGAAAPTRPLPPRGQIMTR